MEDRLCEECGVELGSNDQHIWCFGVVRNGKRESHYYCSEEHTNLGMVKIHKEINGKLVLSENVN